MAREKNLTQRDVTWTFRHFSAVIQDNAIVAMGTNRIGTPVLGYGYGRDYPQNIHAEPDAYRRAKPRMDHISPWEIVNLRLNRSGEIRLSQPCKCCSAFRVTMGCKAVHFTAAIGL